MTRRIVTRKTMMNRSQRTEHGQEIINNDGQDTLENMVENKGSGHK